jgi:hypothetical protein
LSGLIDTMQTAGRGVICSNLLEAFAKARANARGVKLGRPSALTPHHRQGAAGGDVGVKDAEFNARLPHSSERESSCHIEPSLPLPQLSSLECGWRLMLWPKGAAAAAVAEAVPI